MTDDPEDARRKLLGLLGQVENTAERLLAGGQEIVRKAEESRAIAHDLREVVRQVPTGELGVLDFDHLNSVFGAQERQQQALASAVNSRVLSATTTTSTLTASTLVLGAWSTVKVLPSAITPASGGLGPTPAVQQLMRTIRRYSATNEMLRRLGTLSVKCHPTLRSPVELLQEGGRALTMPNAPEPTVTGVLIPAREGVQHLVMSLLTQLPRRAQAANWHDRIIAVGAQVGLPGLDPSHFPNLGGTLTALVASLSDGKRKALSRDDIDQRFDAVLRFVLALLDSVDLSKVRRGP